MIYFDLLLKIPEYDGDKTDLSNAYLGRRWNRVYGLIANEFKCSGTYTIYVPLHFRNVRKSISHRINSRALSTYFKCISRRIFREIVVDMPRKDRTQFAVRTVDRRNIKNTWTKTGRWYNSYFDSYVSCCLLWTWVQFLSPNREHLQA